MKYETEVSRLIRRRYSIDDELALQRLRESKPEEFAAYNAYCEECKVTAKALCETWELNKSSRIEHRDRMLSIWKSRKKQSIVSEESLEDEESSNE